MDGLRRRRQSTDQPSGWVGPEHLAEILGASRKPVAQPSVQMKTRDLFSLVSSLSGVTRFSMLKMCHHETVLEHTGMMVCFCYVLGERLNACKPGTLDMGTLLSKATVHDWDETITGDVARPTK